MKKSSAYIIPIFIPHLGCPNDCIFCNQRSISGKLKPVEVTEVDNIIKEYLEYFKDTTKDIEVAFYGGSFTGLDIEYQKQLLKSVNKYIKKNIVKGIRISTRPDYISRDILDMLKKYNVRTIELGVQSMYQEVLDCAKRGHSTQDVVTASKLIKEYKFILGHQMMIGLPDSTFEKEINTAKELIKLKPNIVRIYPVLVLKGTELAKMFKEERYIPIDLDEAVYRSKELVKLFEESNVNVIRIGLHTSENLSSKKELLSGPYHESFGELVKSQMMLDNIIEYINDNKEELNIGREKKGLIMIYINPGQISTAIGNSRGNVKKLEEMYLKKVQFRIKNEVAKGQFEIEYVKAYKEI